MRMRGYCIEFVKEDIGNTVVSNIKHDCILSKIILKTIDRTYDIGYMYEHIVYLSNCCYLDIRLFELFCGYGIGKYCIEQYISIIKNKYKEIYVWTKDKIKSNILLSIGFRFVEENIYKSLYVLNVS
mgnify:FL=1